jgi:hypothetical protein
MKLHSTHVLFALTTLAVGAACTAGVGGGGDGVAGFGGESAKISGDIAKPSTDTPKTNGDIPKVSTDKPNGGGGGGGVQKCSGSYRCVYVVAGQKPDPDTESFKAGPNGSCIIGNAIVLQSDGSIVGISSQVQFSGNWSQSGDVVSFDVTGQKDGKPVSASVTCTPKAGSTTPPPDPVPEPIPQPITDGGTRG